MRSAWLSLIVLRGVGVAVPRREAVKLLVERLRYTDRQARNVLRALSDAGLVADDGAVVRITQRGEETVAQLLGSLYCPALAHSTWLRGLAPTVLSIPLRDAGER